MRTKLDAGVSAWSGAVCVTPQVDPYAPGVLLRLPSGSTLSPTHDLVVQLDASDLVPSGEGCGYRAPSPVTGCVDRRLIDESLVESGVSEMLVYTRHTAHLASWQPYEPTVAVSLDPTKSSDTVFARVRDAAGNESQLAFLPVRVVEP